MSRGGTWAALAGLLLPLCAAASADAGPAGAAAGPVATLTAPAIVSVEPGAGLTREAFAERWGQFEVRLRKDAFPLPAPHCRRHVILRVPAVAPDAPGHEQALERRWALYQQVLDVQARREASVTVPLDLSLYTERSARGVALRYCNAYVSLR
ncbi:hypothetical protein [Azohydromonas caseinilytica]|uniref:Uncharacterized protein n=1 Tax=Azohydromonas caseinilytica TaxID=2728836 RepID=A0A848FCN2_9BURK|nr:hypothetical protein [Azohydromonas caseinilytica]NML16535.1 hypothetical protein [Azohydromonas caseinilytica]